MSTDVVEEVLAANGELYAAFEAGDADRLEALWDDADDITCVHPGWPVLRGRARVLRSWSLILANTGYIQFFVSGAEVALAGDVAVVTCEENILTELTDADGRLGDTSRVVATNVFRRRGDAWRLWLHHGSPVLAPSGPAFGGDVGEGDA